MSGGACLVLRGEKLLADPSGALLWPAQETLIVADLHLEKGSSLARRGAMLPPYDTRATLDRIGKLLRRHAPKRVISLGDSFHDPLAAARLSDADAAAVRALTGAVEWLWVAGNHDPKPPEGLGGRAEEAVVLGPLAFRHAPRDGPAEGEVGGHLHPKASVRVRGRTLSRRCFATDGKRLVMPAFGSFAGGLNVLDPVVASLFRRGLWAYVLGQAKVHVLPHDRLARGPLQLTLGWR